MDFSSPGIGLGKAGNDPYQWLAAGAHGLQSMLAGSPTNDPGDMGNSQFLGGDWGGGSQTPQFMRAAEVQGEPVSSIPRHVQGLLPVLALKLGLLPQSVSASPDQMNIEQLALQVQNRQKMSDMLDSLSILTGAAKESPQLAAAYYRAMPQIPGVTPETLAKIKSSSQEQKEMAMSETLPFKLENVLLRQQGLENQTMMDEWRMNKGDPAENRADERNRIAEYNAAMRPYITAMSPQNAMLMQPEQLDLTKKVYNKYLTDLHSGRSAAQTESEILNDPKLAPGLIGADISPAAPPSGGGSNAIVDWFMGRGGATPASAAPSSVGPVAPKVVKPSAIK